MTPVPALNEPPSIAHNRPLCMKVMTQTKTHSRYPKVMDQIECLSLELGKLQKFGYNPTLNAKGWMVYRYHRGMASTKLAVAQLHPNGNGAVFSDRELAIGPLSEEDAKLWTFQGVDYLSWVESHYPTAFKSVVKYAKFEGMHISDIQQTAIGNNDGSAVEKNWIYTELNGELHVIYSCAPVHRVYRVSDLKEFASPGPVWPYGEIRGGTAPLPYEGKLLRFFHSRLDNEWAGARHRYYIGAYLMNPEPPFEVVRVSRKPIVYGSEISHIKHNDRPHHWKANVVFVSGAVETEGGWLLSIGENDSRCILGRVKPEQLNF